MEESIHKEFKRLLKEESQPISTESINNLPTSTGISGKATRHDKKKVKKRALKTTVGEENIRVIDPIFKTLEKHEKKKEVLKYQYSFPKIDLPKTPSVFIRNWKRPEEYVDIRMLNEQAARTAKVVSSQYEKSAKEEDTEAPPPWRTLLKLPRLEKVNQPPHFPEEAHPKEEKKSSSHHRMKKFPEFTQRLRRAKELMQLTLEEGEEAYKSEAGIRKKAEEKKEMDSLTKEKVFPTEKLKTRIKVEVLPPAIKATESIESEEKAPKATISEERKWEAINFMKTSFEKFHAEEDYGTITSDHLKNLAEGNPSLKPCYETEEDTTSQFHPFRFKMKQIAKEMLERAMAGDEIDINIMEYLVYSKDRVLNMDIMEEMLERIEEVNYLEDLMRKKLSSVAELEEMKRWDECYVSHLNYYLRGAFTEKEIHDQKVKELKKIKKDIQKTDLQIEDDNIEMLHVTIVKDDGLCKGCDTKNLRVDQSCLYRPKFDEPNSKEIYKGNYNEEIWPTKKDHKNSILSSESIPKANFVNFLTEEADVNQDGVSPLEKTSFEVPFVSKDSSSEFYKSRKEGLELIEDDPYDEELAEIKYLESKPSCFIILGKQGTETKRLAQKIVEFWGCILVDVDSAVKAVVESEDEAGKLLDSMLRTGQKIPSYTAFSLVLQRLQDQELHHYGYVLLGVPYCGKDEKDLTPEQQLGLIFSLEHKPDVIIYVTCPDEDVIYKRSLQRFDPSSQTHVSKELEDINRKVQFLYVHGKDQDPRGEIHEILQEFDEEMKMAEMLNNPDIVKRPRDHHDSVARDLICYREKVHQAIESIIRGYDQQYVIRVDGRAPVIQMFQIVRAKLLILPLQRLFAPIKMLPELSEVPKVSEDIEKIDEEREGEEQTEGEEEAAEEEEAAKKLEDDKDLEDEIKDEDLEGLELSPQQLEEIIAEVMKDEEEDEYEVDIEGIFRSRAEGIRDSDKGKKEGDSEDEDEDDPITYYRNKTPEETFQTLRKKDATGGRFKWNLSQWNYYCPVELVQGRAVLGKLKYAVRFLDKIYYMSSPKAEKIFLQNPRPYLAPPNPIPTCRIFIMGHRFSRKSAVAFYFSKLFHCKVISLKELCKENVEREIRKLQEQHRPELIDEAIQTVKEKLKAEYEEEEESRLRQIEEWRVDIVYLIQEVIILYNKLLVMESRRQTQTTFETTDYETEGSSKQDQYERYPERSSAQIASTEKLKQHIEYQERELEKESPSLQSIDEMIIHMREEKESRRKLSPVLNEGGQKQDIEGGQGSVSEVRRSDSSLREDSLVLTRTELLEILNRLKLPPVLEPDYLKSLLENEEELMKFVPENLRENKPEFPVVNEHNAQVMAIADEKVRQIKVDPLPEVDWKSMPLFIAQAIYNAEDERAQNTGGAFKYGGWILDDIPPDAAIFEKLKDLGIVPDIILCFRDEDPEYSNILSGMNKNILGYDNLPYEDVIELLAEEYEEEANVTLSMPRNQAFIDLLGFTMFPKLNEKQTTTTNDWGLADAPTLSSHLGSYVDIFLDSYGSDIGSTTDLTDEDYNSFMKENSSKIILRFSKSEASDMNIKFTPERSMFTFSSSSSQEPVQVKPLDISPETSARLHYLNSKQYSAVKLIEQYGLVDKEDSTDSFIDAEVDKLYEFLDLEGKTERVVSTVSRESGGRSNIPESYESKISSGTDNVISSMSSADREHRASSGTDNVISSMSFADREHRASSVRFTVEGHDSSGLESLVRLSSEEIPSIMKEVRQELEVFDATYKFFKEDVPDIAKLITEIGVNDKKFSNLVKEILYKIEAMFRVKPEVIIKESLGEDEAEELEEEEEMVLDEEGGEGEMLGEETVEAAPAVKMKSIIPLGDTGMYCPVAFVNNFVLWPGNKKLSIIFHDKKYLMSSEEAIAKFLQHPEAYAPFSSPPKTFPPPRICVVGPSGSGKSTVALHLSKRFGIPYINYTNLLQDSLLYKSHNRVGHRHEDPDDVANYEGEEGDEVLKITNMVRQYLNEGTPLPEEHVKEVLSPLWTLKRHQSLGFILDGFPHSIEDVDCMIKYAFIPDTIIELETTAGTASQRLLETSLLRWKCRLEKKQRAHMEEVVAREEEREKLVDAYVLQFLAKTMKEAGVENVGSDETKTSKQTATLRAPRAFHAVADEQPIFFSTNEKGELKANQVISIEILRALQHAPGKILQKVLREAEKEEVHSQSRDSVVLRTSVPLLPTSIELEGSHLSTIQVENEDEHKNEQEPEKDDEVIPQVELSETPELSKLQPALTEPPSNEVRGTVSDDTFLSENVIQNYDYLEDELNLTGTSRESTLSPSTLALKSLSLGSGTELLRFLPLENIIDWYEKYEHKSTLSEEIADNVERLFPLVSLEKEWEDEEMARTRFEEDIETWLETDFTRNESVKERALQYHIPWLTIDAENELDNVVDEISHAVSQYRYRRESLFETTYDVMLKEAEYLLKYGYYFLSKFGYWCPVQVYEKEIPVQMYLPGGQRGDIYPVIHRRFIYFLAGKENKEKFEKNPLKYNNQDPFYPLFPIRVAIIGPPKCGKSTLSHRLAEHFGLKVITPGSAMRYVLDELKWCELAGHLRRELEEGNIVPTKLVVRSLEAAVMEPRCATQGFILDGFPNTIEQCEMLAEKNLTPFLILHLKSKQSECLENFSNMNDEDFRTGYKYSEMYMDFKISSWFKENEPFHPWVEEEYQNVVTLETDKSKWWLFEAAKKEIFRVMKIILHYLTYVNSAVVPLQHLCVSSHEFNLRKHLNFNNYCPLCLKDGVLTCDRILERKGLVQYKKHYYWICEEHYDLFFQKPEEYTPPKNNAHLPENMPEMLKTDKDSPLSEGHLAAGGFCVVTYIAKQPYGRLVKGMPNFGVIYKGNVYLMCSEECLREFMRTPHNYCDLEINWKTSEPLPPLQLNTLPPMGYLEQTLFAVIKKAVYHVSCVRPKCPGLDAKTSGAIFLGLYLKIHNNKLPLDLIGRYEVANRHLLNTLEYMKKLMELIFSRATAFASWKAECPPPVQYPEEERDGRGSGEGKHSNESSLSSKDKLASKSMSSSEKIGPCGYEYPTGAGDNYMGDFYMQLSGCDSSYDSVFDSTYDPNLYR